MYILIIKTMAARINNYNTRLVKYEHKKDFSTAYTTYNYLLEMKQKNEMFEGELIDSVYLTVVIASTTK